MIKGLFKHVLGSKRNVAGENSRSRQRTTSFEVTRVNTTTFLIKEDDSYAERPHIYAVVHPEAHLIILSDTGCDSPRKRNVETKHLRDFLENHPIAANNNHPLNPGPNRRGYLIICTHCHYDHIGGIEQFSLPHADYPNIAEESRALIVASEAGRDFIENDLDEHSICKYVGMRTPRYTVGLWARDFSRLVFHGGADDGSAVITDKLSVDGISSMSGIDLGLTIIHTPGHTPDELAWYDHSARHLYVGDSFYEEGEEGMPIMFSKDGNWIDFLASMRKLQDFVRSENRKNAHVPYYSDGSEGSLQGLGDTEDWVVMDSRVKVGCGHTTTVADAGELLEEVLELFYKIIRGRVPVVKSEYVRDELYDTWREDKRKTKFSVKAPRRLCEQARNKLEDEDAALATDLSDPAALW